MVSVMIIFYLLAYANIAVAAKLITIPLFKESCDVPNKRSNDRVSERAPYGYKPGPIRVVCREQNLNYGIIKIGSDQLSVHGNSPVNSDGSRDFKVVFDTGSITTWVFGDPEPQKNDYKMSYYKSANLTAMPTIFRFTQFFGNLKTSGMIHIDNICLHKLCAFSQAIGIVTNCDSTSVSHFEGMFGMSNFKDPTASQQYIDKIRKVAHSVLEHLLASNGLTARFALWFNRTGGILSLGGTDRKYYREPIIYTPVISNEFQHWLIIGSHLLINNREIKIDEVVVDSGGDSIYGPEEAISQIYEELQVDQHGFFKCDQIHTFPRMVVVLPHYRVILTPEDYVIKNNVPLHDIKDPETREHYRMSQEIYGKDRCALCFIVYKDWIFGETFLRKVYTVFDVENQRVGFATPKSV